MKRSKEKERSKEKKIEKESFDTSVRMFDYPSSFCKSNNLLFIFGLEIV